MVGWKIFVPLTAAMLLCVGCVATHFGEALAEAFAESMAEVTVHGYGLHIAVVRFYETKERWPATLEDLKTFWEEERAEEPPPVDFDDFSQASFTLLDGDKMLVEFTLADHLLSETAGDAVESASIRGSFEISLEDEIPSEVELREVAEGLREAFTGKSIDEEK